MKEYSRHSELLPRIVVVMRDYSRMAAKASPSEKEREWLRVLGTLNELQARLFVGQKAREHTPGPCFFDGFALSP